MSAKALEGLLAQLEACRYRFGREEAARVFALLNRLDAASFPIRRRCSASTKRCFSYAPFLRDP